MTQEQSQDVLTSEVCRAVVLKLADLACSGQEQTLKAFGVTEQQIHQLSRLSQKEIHRLSSIRKNIIDVNSLLTMLFPEMRFPSEWEVFFLHGANNEMMKHYFGARPEDCHSCRSQITKEQVLKGRTIPHTKHSDVTKSLKAEPDFRRIEAPALLKIAQKHQVSLCAIWNELKKWDKEYDEKKYKR